MKGNFNTVVNSDKPVLVDFYADWCQPCKMQSVILQDVARKMSDKVKFIKIDVDRNPSVSGRYQVQSIPTLILFRNGNVQWRQAGVVDRNVLMNILQKS